MIPPVDEFMGWVFKTAIVGGMSFLWWGKKEDKKLLANHSKDIVRLQAGMVTEDKVRDIVTEFGATTIMPMHSTINEIKELVTLNTKMTNKLEIKMATQEGYQQAFREMLKSDRQ